METEKIELKYREVGMSGGLQERKVLYIPEVVVSYVGRRKKDHYPLDEMWPEKRKVSQFVVCAAYIFMQIGQTVYLYDLTGKRQGQVSVEEYGRLIQAEEEQFILLKGRRATLFNAKGEMMRGRDLTDQEMGYFAKDGAE